MDAFHAPIGGPPTEGSVRLRLPSPTQKESTGLFLLPLLRFASLGISLPAGSDLGRRPKTLPPFRERVGGKLLVFVFESL